MGNPDSIERERAVDRRRSQKAKEPLDGWSAYHLLASRVLELHLLPDFLDELVP